MVRGLRPGRDRAVFGSPGPRLGRHNAIAGGSTETGCGILTVLGLATPLAAAGLSAVMITTLLTGVWNEGFKPAAGQKQERDRPPFALLSRTMTRSAVGDACFLATEQSWRTASRTRSLLSRTSCDSDSRNQGRSAVRAARRTNG